MKIVFFGTSDLAACILRALLLSEHKVSVVVTAQDKRKGRGQKVSASPVKCMSEKENINLLQPKTLSSQQFIQALEDEKADLFVVAAYGKILTKQILEIPKIYSINLHTSLLPKYRGAAPINWAIIKGDKVTGVTVFKLNKYMDQGEMILQKKINIAAKDTSVELTDKLSTLGADAVLQALDLIKDKKEKFKKQDNSKVTLAPKLKKKDGLINWKHSALDIHNQIRGLQPWPGAFTYLDGKLLKVLVSEAFDGQKRIKEGEVLRVDEKKGILVQTNRGHLLIVELQLEGKKRMPATEFVLGYSVKAGTKLGNSSQ